MKLSKNTRPAGILKDGERGTTLIETLVALMVLSVVAVTFLSGLATTLRATAIADRRATADNIAQRQMELLKGTTYAYEANEYTAAPLPSGNEYLNYSVVIGAQPLHSPDDGIQKLTVTVSHSGNDITTLIGYKVDR